jgi:hypothetical protein
MPAARMPSRIPWTVPLLIALNAACVAPVKRAVAAKQKASTENAGEKDSRQARAARDGSACFHAKLLWFEDFETGDYARWTGHSYGAAWGNDCQDNAFSTLKAASGRRSHRSVVTCRYTSEGNVHRGYGGLQFSGDRVLPEYTNSGVGISAPYGVVNTFYRWLEPPTRFANGKWVSFFTVNDDCAWQEDVMTLGLEDPSNILAAAHYWSGKGGTRTFVKDAPGFPFGRWVRITVYVNYFDGVMHVWQDGKAISHVTFSREKNTICQWHWGLYASGDNDNLVLYEDDNSIWKLGQPWTDFSIEPFFGKSVAVCEP